MAEKKMTKRDWYAVLTEIVEASDNERATEVLEFIEHEVELLTKKSSSDSEKKLAKKAEDRKVKDTVLTVLAENRKAMTIGMLMADSRLPLTNQKLTYLLTQMVNEHEVVRTVEKKVPYFSIAVAE